MDVLENELLETQVQLINLGIFSNDNALALQQILERYDGIIEQLYYQDQVIYLQSTVNISIIELKMNLIFLPATNLTAQEFNYTKAKNRIMISVNEDLYNYRLFINRQRLTLPHFHYVFLD